MPRASKDEKQVFLELTTLCRGDESDYVVRLQEHLKTYEFDCGEADGVFGERTEAALVLLQRHLCLPADGIFDADDWYALSFWAEDEFASPDETLGRLWNRLRSLITSIQAFTLKPLQLFPKVKQE